MDSLSNNCCQLVAPLSLNESKIHEWVQGAYTWKGKGEEYFLFLFQLDRSALLITYASATALSLANATSLTKLHAQLQRNSQAILSFSFFFSILIDLVYLHKYGNLTFLFN